MHADRRTVSHNQMSLEAYMVWCMCCPIAVP